MLFRSCPIFTRRSLHDGVMIFLVVGSTPPFLTFSICTPCDVQLDVQLQYEPWLFVLYIHFPSEKLFGSTTDVSMSIASPAQASVHFVIGEN